MKLISITLFVLFASVGLADTYMHQQKGSNNRLNEKSANRRNANRLFDSQNNNRGGYNVGEIGSGQQGFQNNANAYATDRIMFNYDAQEWSSEGNNAAAGNKQFEETFLENSIQSITWTAQHGCANAKNNCNMVFEYTCDTHPQDQNVFTAGAGVYNVVTGLRVQLKNGANTDTPSDPNNIKNIQNTMQNNNNANEGRHESEEWYAFAKNRDRNQGLFTADQKLQGSDSTKTRQNPGGTRRGLEVPEERDYFPYWKPTPWKPIAIFHNSVDECTKQMKEPVLAERGSCSPTKAQIQNLNNNQLNALVNAVDKADCETPTEANREAGTWTTQTLGNELPAGYPQCVQGVWSQVNNLGNVKDTGNGGLPQNWDWQIPTVDQLAASGCHVYKATNTGNANANLDPEYVRLVTRIRYNMTTMDYAPYTTTAACNQNKKAEVQSPVEQNPTVDVGVEMQGLRLALNTAQTGRTFQDRSHVFRVMKNPNWQAQAGANNEPWEKANSRVINVSVQGKRGNIVQTFPAVEYDFWPKIVTLKKGDCAAFQWTGSNTHNNGNPAGDGQAGDAGEGRGGSDRSNLIQIMDKNSTYPAPFDKAVVADFFANSKVFKTYTGEYVSSGTALTAESQNPQTLNSRDAQAYFLSGGYYRNEAEIGTTGNNVLKANNGAAELNVLLNNAPASMRGMTVCPERVGEYEFTCTRNNNFSNRDQKLTIIVED